MKTCVKDTFSFLIFNLKLGDTVVEVSPGYYRPSEVDLLIGDSAKAKSLPAVAGKTWMGIKSEIR